MTNPLIPVAIYARASSDEQTHSVGQQLAALHKEAEKRGYRIVREYIDDGLSGSREIEKRISFHAMIADSYKREFTRIFCYDSSRFGRLDSQIGGEYKVKLRRNGIQGIDTLGEGMIDWSTQMGRLQDALLSEANYEAALKISRSTIRGKLDLLERGQYPHGEIPFGYSNRYTGDGQTIVIPRGKSFRKPKRWSRELIIDEQEAQTVREIYDLYVNRSQSMRQIAILLTNLGVKGWSERGWSWDSVCKILTSKCYLGYGVITNKQKRKDAHNRMAPIEVPGIIPAILEGKEGEELWDRAQAVHKQASISRYRSDKVRALSGCLICGQCGFRLVATQRKTGKSHGPVYYRCISGLKKPTGCPQWRVWESDVLPAIIKELVTLVDQEVIESAAPKQEVEVTDFTAKLEHEVTRLREALKRATMRAATADDDMLAEYEEAAREVKKELSQAEDRLRLRRNVESQGGADAVWADWWAELRPGLVLASGDEELIAEVRDAHEKLPALKAVRGRGGWDEFKGKAREALFRLAADGDTDPLRAIVPTMLDGEGSGLVVDAAGLRAVLRKLGCEVSLWWVPNPEKKRRTDFAWLLDRARITVRFGHAATTASSSAPCGVPGASGHAAPTARRSSGSARTPACGTRSARGT